jgi:hypothetical protein
VNNGRLPLFVTRSFPCSPSHDLASSFLHLAAFVRALDLSSPRLREPLRILRPQLYTVCDHGSRSDARALLCALVLRHQAYSGHRCADHPFSVCLLWRGWAFPTQGDVDITDRLRDDDMAYLMGMNTKELHKLCGRLKEDRFLAV